MNLCMYVNINFLDRKSYRIKGNLSALLQHVQVYRGLLCVSILVKRNITLSSHLIFSNKLMKIRCWLVMNRVRNYLLLKLICQLDISWNSCKHYEKYEFYAVNGGAHGSVIVKALCYKPESRWFEILWWKYSIYLIFPAALGPGVHSASNRNENQKQKNNVSGE
jgi:hypothetical protein